MLLPNWEKYCVYHFPVYYVAFKVLSMILPQIFLIMCNLKNWYHVWKIYLYTSNGIELGILRESYLSYLLRNFCSDCKYTSCCSLGIMYVWIFARSRVTRLFRSDAFTFLQIYSSRLLIIREIGNDVRK